MTLLLLVLGSSTLGCSVLGCSLLGCGEEPLGDARAYAMAANAASLSEGRELCAQIGDAETRSDCLCQVVRERARGDREGGLSTCAEVPLDAWRDECHFLLAEALLDPEDPEPVAPICALAGRYQVSCLKHLWKGYAGHLRREGSLEQAVPRYAEAIPWAGDALDPKVEQQAWALLYRAGMEHGEHIDLALCQGLERDQQRYCEAGLAEAVVRSLSRWVHHNGDSALGPLCGLEDPAGLAEGLRQTTRVSYEPSSRLDAVARQVVDRACKRFEHDSRRQGG